MKPALILLVIQGALGAFDTLFYHEWKTRLPRANLAARELRLHAWRDFAYAIVFGSLAWVESWGIWAWIFMTILLTEIVITIYDFIEEDKTRKLPAGERAMHAIMGIIYGAFLGLLVPILLDWSSRPTGFVGTDYGIISWLLTVLSAGVFLSGMRDLVASARLHAAAAACRGRGAGERQPDGIQRRRPGPGFSKSEGNDR